VLGLAGNVIGDDGAIALADRLPAARDLSLEFCGIGDAGARALLDSPHLGNLTALGLEGNTVSRAVRQELARRFGR
jgi:hypothetical protein